MYKEILSDREASPLLLAINFSRLAAGLVPFGLIALYASKHEYMFAGIASSLLMAAGALTAPYKGRLIMRFSPLRTIVPMSVGYCSFMALGAFLSYVDQPFHIAVVFLFIGTLLVPPTPALVRTLWTRIAQNDDFNRALHALDSVAEELVFAITPLITALLWSTVGAFWAIPLGLLCGFMGTTALIILAGRKEVSTRDLIINQSRVDTAMAPKSPKSNFRSIYLNRATWGILGPILGLGSAMGALSILLTKWSEASLGEQSASGIFLSIISFSGFFAGLFFGKIKPRSLSISSQYQIASLSIAVGVVFISLGSRLLFVVIGSIVLGSAMTIMFIISFVLIGEHYREAQQTEMNAAIGASYDISSGLSNLSAGFLLSQVGLTSSLNALSIILVLLTAMSFLIETPNSHRE